MIAFRNLCCFAFGVFVFICVNLCVSVVSTAF